MVAFDQLPDTSGKLSVMCITTSHFRSLLAISITFNHLVFWTPKSGPNACFWSILGPFGPKNGKTRFFQIKGCESVWSPYLLLFHVQNQKKHMQQLSGKLKKVSFQADLSPFCPNTGKWDFSRTIGLWQFLALMDP